MKYGFIGCGNMGGAIAKALSRATKEIMVSDRSGKAKAFAEELGIVYSDAETIAARCDRIFIAVKPHMVQEVLSPLQKVLGKRKPLLITMAAGMEIAKLEQLAGTELPVIRIMPNTPTAIGKGVIPYCRNALVEDETLNDWREDMRFCGLLDALEERLIDAVLDGRDVLGIMPTGGGKSLCYQIPALLLPGMTVVVSPLISLMKDQVMALKNAGVAAAYVNSSLTGEQLARVYDNIRRGVYKLLYIAPERLQSDGFAELARRLPIALLAVDEAHCISQWGNDFRPSYLRIADFIRGLPTRPVVAAFTATATEQVRRDIEEKLEMRAPLRVVTGFDRPNLRFEVLRPRQRPAALLELVEKRRGKSGIIYCLTRSNVEKVCALLRAHGVPATRYHAGLSDAERQRNQEDFVYDRCPVIAATNAFGMGIDKSNVSYVIHYNMPMSLEAYYQEAGRAGRDGAPAECLLLYARSDVQTAKMLIDSTEGDAADGETRETMRRRAYARLDRMLAYCKTTKCLRGCILDYFGQAHGEACGNCGNCQTVFRQADITVEAQKILSCVKRVQDRLGYPVGAALIARVLHGSGERRIVRLGLQTLST